MRDAILSTGRDRDSSAGNVLNVAALLVISALLGLMFYHQLALRELPSPLGLLQRAGLILTGMGLLMNVRFGVKGAHYGVTLAGAITTGVIASWQALSYIAPGNPGVGPTLLGLHIYTLTALTALAASVAVVILLLVQQWEAPARRGSWHSLGGKLVALLFVLLVAGNLVSTVLQCGSGACLDNQHSYRLLGQ
ncbi:disulfide bond formation protein B [Herbaspirillum sp. alder98]|uniref:disulfide bond formation protein B n=1 Tax=Herbaspirillum sp. alder98 TaxID=2913096 RepID=UPI001CD87515|nr:disulfide bond formation protein B [Herbaspirillum sp. alder98]MCA1326728.1 disulfide bond formation protein B [Herbaspirillum sp. alder98]